MPLLLECQSIQPLYLYALLHKATGFAIERGDIFPGSGGCGVFDVYAVNISNSNRQLPCSSPVCLFSITEISCSAGDLDF
jgi:hypothetical protein